MGPKCPQAPLFLVVIPSLASPRWQVLGLEWPLPASSAPILGLPASCFAPQHCCACLFAHPVAPEPSTLSLSSLPSWLTFILQNAPWILFPEKSSPGPPSPRLSQGFLLCPKHLAHVAVLSHTTSAFLSWPLGCKSLKDRDGERLA